MYFCALVKLVLDNYNNNDILDLMKEYFDIPKINASTLKAYVGDEFSAYSARMSLVDNGPTSAMERGTLVHLGLEEGGNMPEDIMILPFKDRRTKEAKEWEASVRAEGNIVLTDKEFHEIDTMIKRAWNSCPPEVRKLMRSPKAEREIVIQDDTFKAMLDLRTRSTTIDYKTTRHSTPSAVERDAIKLGYHIQAYHYNMLAETDRFIFLFISSVKPFEVFALTASDEFLQYGKQQWQIAYDRYQIFKDIPVHKLPSYDKKTLELPSYVRRSFIESLEPREY